MVPSRAFFQIGDYRLRLPDPAFLHQCEGALGGVFDFRNDLRDEGLGGTPARFRFRVPVRRSVMGAIPAIRTANLGTTQGADCLVVAHSAYMFAFILSA
jgi:hypothetical protein